jgi:hypothetical protein
MVLAMAMAKVVRMVTPSNMGDIRINWREGSARFRAGGVEITSGTGR